MPVYRLADGYGGLGPGLEVGFTTTTQYSCSAIVFYNAATRVLGLYHYAARTLALPGTTTTLCRMINDSNPTLIVVFPATVGGYSMMMGAEDTADGIAMDNEFLEFALVMLKGPDCVLRMEEGRDFPGVSLGPAGPVFGGVGGGGTAPAAMTGTSRVMHGNVAFYHGAGGATGPYSTFLDRLVEKDRDDRYG